MCRIEFADGEDGIWLHDLAERKATKEHRCDDCNRSIAKGERYTYGVWKDDYFNTVKICAHCVAAGRWLQVVCNGHLWPGVIEELREHWDEEYDLRSLGLGRLVLAGERKWRRGGGLVSLDTIRHWVSDALDHLPAVAL